jgi:hypothetical protein
LEAFVFKLAIERLLSTEKLNRRKMQKTNAMNQFKGSQPAFVTPINQANINQIPMNVFNQQGFNFPPLFVSHIGFENRSHSIPTMYEIKIGDICILDALHIIPNNIRPPSMPKYVGKTKPDINTRPFSLKMFVRNVENDSIEPVQEWTIQGGVQYLPLPSHIQSMYTDYIAIGGDFDMLSLVIHGKKLAKNELPSKLAAGNNLPDIRINHNLKFLDDEYDESADEFDYEDEAADPETSKRTQQLRHLMTMSTSTHRKRILKSQLSKADHLVEKYFDDQGKFHSDKSRVSIKAVSDLLDVVFNVSLDNIAVENIHSKIADLEKLRSSLDHCWQVS